MRTETVPIRQYATIDAISDELDGDALDLARRFALTGWNSRVKREGYQPVGEPAIELHANPFPMFITDEETGEEIKLPDRAFRVVGRVVPAWVPLPPGFDVDAPTIAIPVSE